MWGLVFVPDRLHKYCRHSLGAIADMQRSLSARPPLGPGGPVTCRNCGAALDVARGAAGARCLYCHTDNLVDLPSGQAEVAAKKEERFHMQVTEALAEQRATRLQHRAMLPHQLGMLGVKLLPIVLLLGSCSHFILADGHVTITMLHRAPATEGKLFPIGGGHPLPRGQVVSDDDLDGDFWVALERGQRVVAHCDDPAVEISFEIRCHDLSLHFFADEGWVVDQAAKRSAPYTGWYQLDMDTRLSKNAIAALNEHKAPPLKTPRCSWTASPP